MLATNGSAGPKEYYAVLACQGECTKPQYLSEADYDRQLKAMRGPTNTWVCPDCGDMASLIEEQNTRL